MWEAAAGDHGFDARCPDEAAVFVVVVVVVVVVAAVAEEAVGSVAWPSDQAGDGRGLQLGDVVAVSAGRRDGEWDALAVDDEVVLGARTCSVDRAGTAFGPRRAALTWEELITARGRSGFFATRSSTRCSWSGMPASFQAASRRQQVVPEPKPSSCGRYSHWIPVCSTNRILQSACRSGTRGRPSTCFSGGLGNNGLMGDHSSSGTIHGRRRFPTADQRPAEPEAT